MQLSAPIYQLKRKAKRLARAKGIPLYDALNQVAAEHGFSRWSLLVAKASAATPAHKLFPRLSPGDLLLVGARPGQGKTMLSIGLSAEAVKAGRKSVYFTLEYTEEEALRRFRSIGFAAELSDGRFELDCSDRISADYIIQRLADAAPETLVVIDYLQLLDQKREHPELMAQVRALKAFARTRGLIFVFISQIDRSYDPEKKQYPDLGDVRLPNPLDLSLFSKTCFLNNGEAVFGALSQRI